MIALLTMLAAGIAWLLMKLDYVVIAGFVWLLLFGAGMEGHGLFAEAGIEVHPAIQLVVIAAALGVWYGIQQIRIGSIYVFKILASAISAFLCSMFIAGLLDVVWAVVLGVGIFIITLGLRIRDDGLRHYG